MKRAAWLLAWCLVLWWCGCATSTPPLPTPGLRDGSERAVAIVWRVYGRTDLPPVIHWVQGSALSCTSKGGRPGFPAPIEKGIDEYDVECMEGLTLTPMSCYVAWSGPASFSETLLAHELLHVAQFRDGILDPLHTRPEWAVLVPRADAAIVEAGL